MMSQPLRVLILPSCYPEEDSPLNRIFFKDQAAALCRHGCRADVVYFETRRLRFFEPQKLRQSHFQMTETIEDGIRTLRVKGWNTLTQTLPGALLWVSFTKMLVKRYCERYGKPDLVHAHEGLWAGYAASGIATQLGIPYVVTEHSSIFPEGAVGRYLTPFLRRTYVKARKVVVVSSSLGRAMAKYLDGITPLVVPNVVDTDFFVPPDTERPTDRFVFLAVGHLVPVKRHDVLIRAFAEGFRNRERVALEIGGDGPEKDALIRLAREAGVENQVKFLGALSREEVREAFWRASVFVHSSSIETFGVVLAEAMATGLSVVSTRCGGPDDVLSEGGGLLVPPNDVSALRVSMEAALAGATDPPSFCRQLAVRRFSTTAVASKLKELYNEVASS